jgi:hypothetical protein
MKHIPETMAKGCFVVRNLRDSISKIGILKERAV